MSLYPLKFRPRFVEKLWGGRKLQTVLGKSLPAEKLIGESWELYDFPPGVVESSDQWVSSEIANGPLAGKSLHWAVGNFGSDLYGRVPLTGKHGQFPILIKFLDAKEDLSVQVHPDQKYASNNAGAHLKTEAWYVLQNDPESRLLMGMRPGSTRATLEEAIRRGNVEEVIQAVPASEGECFYLPSGTVHALGAGLLVAEVQTPSDTTFRVFDFNRIDPSTGKLRDLHVEQALACINFDENAEPASPGPSDSRLVTSPYFHIERLRLHPGTEHRIQQDGPVVLIILHGSADLLQDGGPQSVPAARGEVVLLPAVSRGGIIRSSSGCTTLQVTFPAADPA